MNWKIVAHHWLERLVCSEPVEPGDSWEETPAPAPKDYDPPHCRECGDTLMQTPRRTICCGEVLCTRCARELFEEQVFIDRCFVCPFCGTSYGHLQPRVCKEVLEEFRKYSYFQLR